MSFCYLAQQLHPCFKPEERLLCQQLTLFLLSFYQLVLWKLILLACLINEFPPFPSLYKKQNEAVVLTSALGTGRLSARSLVVTLHFWYSPEFRQSGKWSCTEQVPLFLLPHCCFTSESCRHFHRAECFPISCMRGCEGGIEILSWWMNQNPPVWALL